ncbi:MAG: hypothetical protein IKA68_06995 [Clostridia bacterium]|nr:hypothetical protein [Clostridia bacterium]
MKKIICILLLSCMLLLSVSCNKTDQNGDGSDNQSSTPAPDDSSQSVDMTGKLVLSGENRYRVIYAPDTKRMALRIQDKLTALDPSSSSEIGYYKLLSDKSTEDDGSLEILVGLTNREASATAATLLSSYLDYAISVSDKKIAIVANTPERLEEAVDKFVSLIKAYGSGTKTALAYDGEKTIIDNYSGYAHASLTLGDAPIKNFSVVIPENSAELEQGLAENIVNWLKTASGVVLQIRKDTETEQKNEILIGATNREASADIKNGTTVFEDSHYCIRMSGGKLVIAASSKRGYGRAFSNFKTELINNQSNIKDGTDIMNTQTTRSLDGKNILFMGNSFVYYGFCIIEGNQKSVDHGYLYQICKANGDEVNVYDYVWGGKDLKWIYDNHLSVADPEFLKTIDIVFMSEAGNNNASLIEDIEEIQALFPETTEFYYMSHAYVHQANTTHIKDAFPKLIEKGIPVGDWGAIAYDLWRGAVKFPESKITYNKETFIKNKGDTYHQNMLSGYLTAQMAYCLATGVSAVGQDYSFCCDTSINSQFDVNKFIENHYNEGTTNMDMVFESAYDMLEIQKLIDEYIDRVNFS